MGQESIKYILKLCIAFASFFMLHFFAICRKKMQRIVPNKLTSGTVQCAFDDVNIDHPDFLYIQCKLQYLSYWYSRRSSYILETVLFI
jgi:hypothetical protein